MKYTIEGFNQEYAISLQKKIIENDKEKIIKLDCIDLVILRWFVDFWNSGEITKLEDEGVQYAWVNYQGVLKRMPILNFSKQALADRFKKMSILDILEQKIIKKGGTFSCYKFGKNFKKLICSDIEGKCLNTKGVSSELQNGIVIKHETKESSIINNNLSEKEYTPYNPPKGESENKNYNSDLFNKFWDAYPKKKSKGNVEKWFAKNKPSEELVNRMIDKINLLKETEQWKSNNGQYIPYPASWLNAKGWEDETVSETENSGGRELKQISEGFFQLC